MSDRGAPGVWCPATPDHRCARPRDCIGALCVLVSPIERLQRSKRRSSITTLFEVRARPWAVIVPCVLVGFVLGWFLLHR